MKTIGIIVGTEDEAISKQYYQKYKPSPTVLKKNMVLV